MAGNTGVTATCQHPIINTHLHPDMVRLHLTRALLAAAITLCVMPVVVSIIVAMVWVADGYPPSIKEVVEHYIGWLPIYIMELGVLIVLIMVVGPISWILPALRRSLTRPWVAAIVGAACGILLTWPWMAFVYTFVVSESGLQWAYFVRMLPFRALVAAITGALHFFLHSFFIRQALRKKAWLETQA